MNALICCVRRWRRRYRFKNRIQAFSDDYVSFEARVGAGLSCVQAPAAGTRPHPRFWNLDWWIWGSNTFSSTDTLRFNGWSLQLFSDPLAKTLKWWKSNICITSVTPWGKLFMLRREEHMCPARHQQPNVILKWAKGLLPLSCSQPLIFKWQTEMCNFVSCRDVFLPCSDCTGGNN